MTQVLLLIDFLSTLTIKFEFCNIYNIILDVLNAIMYPSMNNKLSSQKQPLKSPNIYIVKQT